MMGRFVVNPQPQLQLPKDFYDLSSTFQVSVDAVRELDRKLFESYIERRADPIAGSLEPGIYAGYFDWRDCQTPTGTTQEMLTPTGTLGMLIKTWDSCLRL